jgi:hypothetical protein
VKRKFPVVGRDFKYRFKKEYLLSILEDETQKLRSRDRKYWREKLREIREIAKNKGKIDK